MFKEKTIKGTNEVFLNILNTLNKLTNITGKLGYAISKTRKKISQELEPFEEQQKLLIEKYGVQEESGRIVIKPQTENFKLFIQEIQPLAELPMEISFWQVSQEDFDNNESLFNSNANVNDFDLLQEFFIIKEQEKN